MVRKGLDDLFGNGFVCLEDVGGASGVFLVAIMACSVASPDDKIDLVLEVGTNPVESCVYEGHGRVAVGGFGAIRASGPLSTVAGEASPRGGVYFVELIGMEI